MFRAVDTRDPAAVESEVRSIYAALFPQGDATFVTRAFGWITQCFAGRHADYQPLDTRYHDVEHTLQGTLCLARLLRGRDAAGATPKLTAKAFELGLLAILFHDTGYLRRRDDTDGTGAKYTAVHVHRSASFADDFLAPKGFAEADVAAVQNMIHCTGVDTNLKAIPFHSELERIVGYALGTADLLGQMSASDYVEKLPVLFDEFAEASRNPAIPMPPAYSFSSSDELMRKTPSFWDKFVHPKIDQDFGGLYKYLNDPYPDGPNVYVQRVEQNVARLRERMGASAAKRV
jgi:hypothetical protein